jgi:hypothetical protein
LVRVIARDFGFHVVSGKKSLWVMTDQIHPVNPEKN